MSLRSRLATAWNAFLSKAAPQGYGGWYNAGPAFSDAFRSRRAPSSVELVEAYKSIAYSCAQINAGAVVRTPLRLYVTTAKGQATPKCGLVPRTSVVRSRLKSIERRPEIAKYLTKAESVDEVAEHPLLESIVNANPDFDQTALLKFTSLSLDIVGSAFWVPDEFKLGVPSLLWPIHAQYVFPERRSGGLQVERWVYFGQSYEPNQIIRFRMVSLKDPYGIGYSPLQAAFEHARLHDSFTSVQDSLLNQGVRPSIIVSPKDSTMPMGKDERARFESDINRRLSGGGTGRAWVTDGSIDVTPLTFPPSDLASLEISDNALERFANCFGVPLSLLQTESVNLANLEAGLRQHAQMAVEPRCVEIAGSLTRWAHNYSSGLRRTESRDRGWDRLFFAFDNPVAEDVERQAKVFDLQIKNGSLTINEARAEQGLPPVAWGEEPWLSNTMAQPTTLASREDRAAQIAANPQPALPAAGNGSQDQLKPPEKPEEKSYWWEREDGADPFSVKAPPRERNDDEDGHHEQNTFDLPDGESLKKALQKIYKAQLKKILGTMPRKFADIPDDLMDMLPLTDRMTQAMTPILTAYWDEAGKAIREDIGLDPSTWEVTDPHLKDVIRSTTFEFCQSTNATTTASLKSAHDGLRQQLEEGVLEEGEAIPQLTKRVQQIFEGLEKHKAELIAKTETSRAVHNASLMSARESGVVTHKKWLLSEGSCPLCHQIAEKSNKGGIGLDENFAEIGNNEFYKDIKMPPGHPGCRCTCTYVVDEALLREFGIDPTEVDQEVSAVPPEIEKRVEDNLAGNPTTPKPKPKPKPRVKPKPVAPVEVPQVVEVPVTAPAPEAPEKPREITKDTIAAIIADDTKAESLRQKLMSILEKQVGSKVDELVEVFRKSEEEVIELTRQRPRGADGSLIPLSKLGPEFQEFREKYQKIQATAADANAKYSQVRSRFVDTVTTVYGQKEPAKLSEQALSRQLNPATHQVAIESKQKGMEFLRSITSGKLECSIGWGEATLNGPERAYAYSETGEVFLGRSSNTETVVHEVAHVLELQNPGTFKAVKAFLEYRVGNEEPKPMGELSDGYDHNEFGRDDDFAKAFNIESRNLGRYAGKVYGPDDYTGHHPSKAEATELLSLGVEQLYRDPLHFAVRDPEYFKLVTKALNGDFVE